MKGPGFRIDLDVRRVWICTRCMRVRKLPGSVTAAICPYCGRDAGDMKLEEKKRVERPFRPPVYHEIEVEDEDVESETPHVALAGDAPVDTADQLEGGKDREAYLEQIDSTSDPSANVEETRSGSLEVPHPDTPPTVPSAEETADFLQELQQLEEQSRQPPRTAPSS